MTIALAELLAAPPQDLWLVVQELVQQLVLGCKPQVFMPSHTQLQAQQCLAQLLPVRLPPGQWALSLGVLDLLEPPALY